MTAHRALACALRRILSGLMAKGLISPGRYSIVTGVAMLCQCHRVN